MSQSYSLTVYNKSSFSGQVIVYQGKPASNISPDQIVTLAWLTEGIEKRDGGIINSVEFDWTIDYSFVSARAGTLKPGVNFKAAGIAPIQSYDPPVNNKIQFTKGDNNYTFKSQANGDKGKIHISTDDKVVQNEASIGVAMSGAGTFAIVARPLFDAWFIPHPTYTIALGSYQAGDVMDVEMLSQTFTVDFAGTTSFSVTYNENGTWSPGPPSP